MKVTNSEKFRKNVQNKLAIILNNNNYGLNLERGIYNKTLSDATEKNIVKKWENAYFVLLYTNRFKMIYINLKNQDVKNLNDKNLKF